MKPETSREVAEGVKRSGLQRQVEGVLEGQRKNSLMLTAVLEGVHHIAEQLRSHRAVLDRLEQAVTSPLRTGAAERVRAVFML